MAKTIASAPTAEDGYAFNSPGYAWFVTLVLAGLGIASFIDHQLLALLVEPLRRDFGVSDVQVSLLQGFAFTIFYAFAAIPIGVAADRWPRKWIIIAGAGLWSAATILCIAAKSYPMLFAARMLIGLGEAGLIPCIISILSDFFPKKRLSGAISAIAASSFLGSGATLGLGGLVISHMPKGVVDLPLIGAIHGWQLTFGIAAIPSIALILILLGVREPPRREDAALAKSGATPLEIGVLLMKSPIFWASLVIGMAALNAYQYGLTNWTVSFFIRSYGWSAAQIGPIFGLYFVVLGPLASVTGGLLCNHLVSRMGAAAVLLVALGASIIALPLVEIFALNGNGLVSAIVLGLLTFVVIVPLGCGLAAIPLFAPNRMRAQLTAVYMLIMTLLGSGGGPWLVAAATEYLFRNVKALKYSLSLVDGLLLATAIVCFWAGSRGVARQVQDQALEI